MNQYTAKIIEIQPCTRDEGGPIIDAKAKIQIDDNELWCFIPDWRSENWSINDKGKSMEVKLSFVYFTSNKALMEKKELRSKNEKTPEIYTLYGEVKKKQTYTEEIDILLVDCGIILPIKIKKGKFGIDDYIKAEGRLDAYKVE